MPLNIDKLAQLSRTDILRIIQRPKAIQQVRGRYHVAVELNTQLVERALELRKTRFGVQFEDFRRMNVSVWDVSIGDKIGHFERRLFDSGNFPASTLDRIWGKGEVSVGFHSEGLIAQRLLDLRHAGKKIKVYQIYTERWPCHSACAPILDLYYSETPIFHSLRRGEESRAEKLMEAYGIVVR